MPPICLTTREINIADDIEGIQHPISSLRPIWRVELVQVRFRWRARTRSDMKSPRLRPPAGTAVQVLQVAPGEASAALSVATLTSPAQMTAGDALRIDVAAVDAFSNQVRAGSDRGERSAALGL